MTKLRVRPRQTPGERSGADPEIDVDERIAIDASTIEEWVTPRQNWDFSLHEGHAFGRVNNVEGRILYVDGEQTSSVQFRLEQLDLAEDTQEELILRFEEDDGVAKIVRCLPNGLAVELFHLLTYT
jgi:hypothetical protein